ncbi:MAG: 6,7-dimethyl-8-ribityllumazine synthase, partial [Ignavibacteriaceae bacterium]
LKYQLPVIFGVLTTDTVDQAVERADTKGENKGRESATTALEMIDLFKKLS